MRSEGKTDGPLSSLLYSLCFGSWFARNQPLFALRPRVTLDGDFAPHSRPAIRHSPGRQDHGSVRSSIAPTPSCPHCGKQPACLHLYLHPVYRVPPAQRTRYRRTALKCEDSASLLPFFGLATRRLAEPYQVPHIVARGRHLHGGCLIPVPCIAGSDSRRYTGNHASSKATASFGALITPLLAPLFNSPITIPTTAVFSRRTHTLCSPPIVQS